MRTFMVGLAIVFVAAACGAPKQVKSADLTDQAALEVTEGPPAVPTLGKAMPLVVGDGWLNPPKQLVFPDYVGKVVVIEICDWDAKQCDATRERLMAIEKAHGGKVVPAAVLYGVEGDGAARAYANEKSLQFPVGYGISVKETAKKFGISKFPVSYVVNGTGLLAWLGEGDTPDLLSQRDEAIRRALSTAK